MRKEVCSHQDKAAAKPSQQPSGFQIFILRHFYPTITCKKVGIMDMCWWTVTLLTKDILDFVNLLEWDFSSKYPSWILCEFSNNPNLLSGLQWASFYLNWRRTCHLGPFQEQPSPEICYLWLSMNLLLLKLNCAHSDCCQHSSSGLQLIGLVSVCCYKSLPQL